MEAKILERLKKCDTLYQMTEVLKDEFNTHEKLGLMQKGGILVGVDKLIQMAKLQPKKK